jgi:hypothetical protein
VATAASFDACRCVGRAAALLLPPCVRAHTARAHRRRLPAPTMPPSSSPLLPLLLRRPWAHTMLGTASRPPLCRTHSHVRRPLMSLIIIIIVIIIIMIIIMVSSSSPLSWVQCLQSICIDSRVCDGV